MEALVRKLSKKLKLQKFRKNDDILQAMKGQPSLRVEDTGKQYQNDKIGIKK